MDSISSVLFGLGIVLVHCISMERKGLENFSVFGFADGVYFIESVFVVLLGSFCHGGSEVGLLVHSEVVVFLLHSGLHLFNIGFISGSKNSLLSLIIISKSDTRIKYSHELSVGFSLLSVQKLAAET